MRYHEFLFYKPVVGPNRSHRRRFKRSTRRRVSDPRLWGGVGDNGSSHLKKSATVCDVCDHALIKCTTLKCFCGTDHLRRVYHVYACCRVVDRLSIVHYLFQSTNTTNSCIAVLKMSLSARSLAEDSCTPRRSAAHVGWKVYHLIGLPQPRFHSHLRFAPRAIIW